MDTELQIENGVLIGRDGELYLAHGGHGVLDYASGRRQVAPGMFRIFEANILHRAEQARRLGAKYLHVIFPDKQSVVRQRYPVSNPVCLGELYAARCPQAAPHILNLTGLIREMPERAYKITDTHLADTALIRSACRIAELLTGHDHTGTLLSLLGKRKVERRVAGDMGLRFTPPRESTETFLYPDWPIQIITNELASGNDGLIDICLSREAIYPSRVLWFGDSFGRGSIRFLSFFFREIMWMRTRFYHNEIANQFQPDFLITQNVERYLDVVEPDEAAPPFLLYPFLKGLHYAPPASFTAALAAVLSFPHARYQTFARDKGWEIC